MELLDISRAIAASQEPDELESSSELEQEEQEEEEEKEEPEDIGDWKASDNHVNALPFINPTGPYHIPHAVQSPLQYLQLFLSAQMMQYITDYTNDNAQQHNAEREWTTTSEELYAFIGIHIYMGICDLPQWHMYWSEEYQQPFVSHTFSQQATQVGIQDLLSSE
jgi:hypothetical protein